jgi:hypothetical protein
LTEISPRGSRSSSIVDRNYITSQSLLTAPACLFTQFSHGDVAFSKAGAFV